MDEPILCKLLRNRNTKKDEIKDKLLNYFSNHKYFSFYSAIDEENQYKGKKFYLYFGLPDKWEDKEDEGKYVKSISENELCFIRCLTYQQTESIAMWHMYGLPNNVRITIKGSALRNGLGLLKKHKEILRCYLVCNGNKQGTKFEIDSSDIEKFDLLYYSKNKDDKQNTYFVQKGSNVVVKTVDGGLISQLKDEFCLKHFAFASEVETRLQIRMKKDFLKEYLPKESSFGDICGLAIEPNFSEQDVREIKIVRRPGFLAVKDIIKKFGDKMIAYKAEYPDDMYAEKIKVGKSELDSEIV